jgi:hypothetical protein
MSCLNILYIKTIHVGVHYCNYKAIICSYLQVLFWLWSSLFILPFDFLMEQPHCSDLVVVMFYTVYFYISLVWFSLFHGFIHLLHFCIWLRCVSDCNWTKCWMYWLCGGSDTLVMLWPVTIWIHIKRSSVVWEHLLVYTAWWWLYMPNM